MKRETLLAIGAMMQAAAHSQGVVGPVQFTVCRPREYKWCGAEDEIQTLKNSRAGYMAALTRLRNKIQARQEDAEA